MKKTKNQRSISIWFIWSIITVIMLLMTTLFREEQQVSYSLFVVLFLEGIFIFFMIWFLQMKKYIIKTAPSFEGAYSVCLFIDTIAFMSFFYGAQFGNIPSLVLYSLILFLQIRTIPISQNLHRILHTQKSYKLQKIPQSQKGKEDFTQWKNWSISGAALISLSQMPKLEKEVFFSYHHLLFLFLFILILGVSFLPFYRRFKSEEKSSIEIEKLYADSFHFYAAPGCLALVHQLRFLYFPSWPVFGFVIIFSLYHLCTAPCYFDRYRMLKESKVEEQNLAVP